MDIDNYGPGDAVDSRRDNGWGDGGADDRPRHHSRSRSRSPRRGAGGPPPPPPPQRGYDDRNRSRSPEGRYQRDRPAYDDRSAGRDEPNANNPGNNLFVSNISNEVSEADLEDTFAKYGKVARCQVMRDPHSQEHRGFAFVTMSTFDEAEECKRVLSGFSLRGRSLLVQTAKRGRPRTPTPGRYYGGPKNTRPHPSYGMDRGSPRDRYDRDFERGPPRDRYERDYERGPPRERYERDFERGPPRDRYERDFDRAPPRDRGYERDYDRAGRDGGYDRAVREFDRAPRGGAGGYDYGYDRAPPPPRDYDRGYERRDRHERR